jgi:hypothetical protein
LPTPPLEFAITIIMRRHYMQSGMLASNIYSMLAGWIECMFASQIACKMTCCPASVLA